MVGYTCGVIEYEISYKYGEAEKTRSIILNSIGLVTTICLLIAIFIRYQTRSRSKYDTLCSTGEWKPLTFELIVCSIGPLPFLQSTKYKEGYSDYQTTVEYRVNDILLLLMCLIRIYLVIRCILTFSFFMGTRSQRICNMSGSEASYLFSLKALMKKKPYTVLLTSLVLSVALFGFTLRIFERPLSEASGQNFDAISNSFWVTLITMTTVGYGDFFPKSNTGRLVGIIIAFWGVLFVSLFVVTLTNLLELKGGEKKSYELL